MVTEKDLTNSYHEFLFDVTVVIGNGRFRTLCYLIQETEEENMDDPDLYLRFCDNDRLFRLEKIIKITQDNLHLYKDYNKNTLL